jgi:hypothetical protein
LENRKLPRGVATLEDWQLERLVEIGYTLDLFQVGGVHYRTSQSKSAATSTPKSKSMVKPNAIRKPSSKSNPLAKSNQVLTVVAAANTLSRVVPSFNQLSFFQGFKNIGNTCYIAAFCKFYLRPTHLFAV